MITARITGAGPRVITARESPKRSCVPCGTPNTATPASHFDVNSKINVTEGIRVIRYRLAQLLWVVLLVSVSLCSARPRRGGRGLASWYGPVRRSTTASGETTTRTVSRTAHPSRRWERSDSQLRRKICTGDGQRPGPLTGIESWISRRERGTVGTYPTRRGLREVTCADGGIYPNCMPDSPRSRGIAVEEVPAYNPVQDATTPQYETTLSLNHTSV